jgi:ketosteroid isomerase-like protein
MTEAASNAEIVRRGYTAFNSADMETLAEIFDDAASWHTPGRSPVAGDAIGRDAVFARFAQYGIQSEGTFQAELHEILSSDRGAVVGIHRNTAKRNGNELDTLCCIVFQLRNGQIISGHEYIDDLHQWDAFWS